MKRICFIGFGLFTIGGCQRVTISLANNLCDKYETHLLSLCEIPKNHNYEVNEKIKVHTLDMPLDIRARHSLMVAGKIKKFLKNNKIDILFIAGSLPIPLICAIKPFVNTKIVFCDHENLFGRDKKSIFFRKIACKISNKVVVLTKQTLNDYKNKFNIKDDKISQIYNFIDCVKFENCDLNSKKIISVGRISSEKGFDMAVEVASDVFSKHPDWQWHIYGDGPAMNEIKSKIKEYGLEDNFVMKGADSSVRNKYKNYSICVLPSYREGFAVVLLEAKINSMPVVSFDCNSGPGEIINDEMDGYLIPCYNKKNMAEKICNLIENFDLRKSFSSHAKDNLEKFSKDKIVSQWVSLIESL